MSHRRHTGRFRHGNPADPGEVRADFLKVLLQHALLCIEFWRLRKVCLFGQHDALAKIFGGFSWRADPRGKHEEYGNNGNGQQK